MALFQKIFTSKAPICSHSMKRGRVVANAPVQFRSGFAAHLFQMARKWRCLSPPSKITRKISPTIGLTATIQLQEWVSNNSYKQQIRCSSKWINRNRFQAFRNTWRLEKNLIWSLRTITIIINLLSKVKEESRQVVKNSKKQKKLSLHRTSGTSLDKVGNINLK